MESVDSFFDSTQEQEIVAAIKAAELETTGEIRVHLESETRIPAVERAQQVFSNLGMEQTKNQTGVLIYIAVKNHLLAIIGDKGIDAHLPKDYWVKHLQALQNSFVNGSPTEGLVSVIKTIGQDLKKFVPATDRNPNELSNTLSKGI